MDIVAQCGRAGIAPIRLDVGGASHKQIAIRDVFFMVGWYEQYQLGLAEKSNVAYDAVVAAITNYTWIVFRPFWTLVLEGVYLAGIYGLAVYGDRRDPVG